MSARRQPSRSSPARRVRRPTRRPSRALLASLLALSLASIAAGAIIWAYAGPGPTATAGLATTLLVPRGAGAAQIGRQLAEAGVIRSQALFVLAAHLEGGTLKAGEYAFPSGASMARVLADLRHGRVVRRLFTVPEGWTSAMVAEALTRYPVLTGPVELPPEGTILPETYEVQRGESRQQVIRRMQAAQQALLVELWPNRRPGLPFATPLEAVTLASIVEKETAVPAERPRIAAVYVNRLRAGMRLESDPTIIYGVSQGRALGRGITRSELDTPTPYNTYRVAGLPPTPIANPGRAAIAAVLTPPATNELFFVADGDGGHVFAADYEQHQKNVAKWRAIERAQAAVPQAR